MQRSLLAVSSLAAGMMCLSNTGGLTATLCQDLLPGRWLNTDIKLEGYVSPPVDCQAVDW